MKRIHALRHTGTREMSAQSVYAVETENAEWRTLRLYNECHTCASHPARLCGAGDWAPGWHGPRRLSPAAPRRPVLLTLSWPEYPGRGAAGVTLSPCSVPEKRPSREQDSHAGPTEDCHSGSSISCGDSVVCPHLSAVPVKIPAKNSELPARSTRQDGPIRPRGFCSHLTKEL